MGEQVDLNLGEAAGEENRVPQFVEISSLLRQSFFEKSFRVAAMGLL